MRLHLRRRRIAVGCALGADGLHVAMSGLSGSEPVQFSLGWSGDLADATWEARFSAAMQQIVARCGTAHLTLRVALLPPVVRHRFVPLPAMSLDDARRVLRRDAVRYFCGVNGEQELAVTRVSRNRGPPLSVATVDVALLDALERAVTGAGAHLGAVHSACDVWGSLFPQGDTAGAGSSLSVAVVGDVRCDRLEVRRGRMVGLRYGPARLFDGAADLTIADDETWRQRTATRVRRGGGWAQLVLERIREAASRRAWRDALRRGIAAAAILVLASGLDLWGLFRERAQLRAVRRAEREATTEAMALREDATVHARVLTALTNARGTAPRWTTLLAHLAETLPTDAYLTGLQAAADSVVIEGVAGSAAGVFNALHEMHGVTQVRALAPIRHERTDGEAAIERFVIGLTLSDSTVSSKP